MKTANPYNYNLPVGPDMFFGRQSIVETLTTSLVTELGDSFALIGGRRMGKTSLLEAILRQLQSHRQAELGGRFTLLPVFVDFTGDGTNSVSAFFQNLARETQEAYKELINQDIFDPLVIGEQEPPARIFQRFLTKWGQLVLNHQGARFRLILLMDECEQIVEKPWSSDLYGALRYLLVGQSTRSLIKVVMAGSHRFLTQVHQHGSPLRNVLAYHMLQVLDTESIYSLINEPTKYMVYPGVADIVAIQSGGHPFLAQYLMSKIWELGIENTTPETVHQIAADFSHYRNDFWDWLNGLSTTAQHIYSILSDKKTLAEVQLRSMLRPTPADLLQGLDALCYYGLLRREAASNSYQITSHMFRDWFVLNISDQLGKTAQKQAEQEIISEQISVNDTLGNIAMNKSTRIFISSTWIDLQPEREAVEKALHRMQSTTFAGMEYFGSRDETPREVSLAEVDRSDIYVGIFAHRYGSGITEAEYRRARERKLPCLIYIKDDDAPILPAHIERDAEKSTKLENLKRELKLNHTASSFHAPDNLATQVVADLHNLLGKAPATGQEQPAQPGTKYAIHIGNAQGLVIGDGATVTQNFGGQEKPASTPSTESFTPSDPLANQLYETLTKRFDLEELRTLCFRVGVEFDDLRGEGRDGKARELVRRMQRKDQLQRLQSAIEQTFK